MNRLLDKEWFLKILALLLALGLWVSVHPGFRPTTDRSYLVPIQTWGLAQDKTVRLTNEKVRLQVAVAAGSELKPASLRVGVTVSGLTPGWHRLTVQPRLPAGVRFVAVVPVQVRLLVKSLGHRTAAVTAVPEGRMPPGLALQGLRVQPARVGFWGAAGDLRRVRWLRLGFKLPTAAGGFRVQGLLSARDSRGQPVPGIRLAPSTATVSGQAYTLSQVSLPVLALTSGALPVGFTVTALQVSPPSLAVLPGSETLPLNLVTQPVPLNGRTISFTARVPVVVPTGAALTGDGTVMVTVSIRPSGGLPGTLGGPGDRSGIG